MSEEHATPALTGDQIDRILQAMADSFGQQLRSPVLHWPSEQDLDYQDVTFPALDGVTPEGWFIPATGSDKLIIANHPMGFSRSGIPTHLEPWRSIWASSGNDFEVNLLPDYKILHDAGYNVLAYDLRFPSGRACPRAAATRCQGGYRVRSVRRIFPPNGPGITAPGWLAADRLGGVRVSGAK